MSRFSFLLTFVFYAFTTNCLADDLKILNQNHWNLAQKTTLLSKAKIDSLLLKMDSTGKFSDINYAYTGYNNGGLVKPHLDRLAQLAKFWQNPTSEYYHNKSLQNKIYLGMDYWITLNLKDGNWWHRVIHWPQAFIPSLILIKDSLKTNNKALYGKACTYMRYSSTYPGMSGANATDVAQVTLATASLMDSLSMAKAVAAKVSTEFKVKTGSSEGFYSDYSFNQHNAAGRQLYFGGYGTVLYTGFYNLQSALQGTSFEFSTAIQNDVVQLMIEGFGKTVYKNYADIFTFGRGFGRSGEPKSSSYLSSIQNLQSLGIATLDQQKQLQNLRDRIEKSSISTNFIEYNKAFPHADFMTHQRKNWYTSVRGVSTRTVGNESGNGEGLKNFHFGDGANLILHQGNEYGQIYPTWNWKRIPGITVEQNSGTLPEVTWGAGGNGKSSFAGGVSDGQFGLYAFVFDRASVDSNVKAKKAWFFFDQEYVALGAQIQAHAAQFDVYTSINQSLLLNSPIVWGQNSTSGTLAFSEKKYFSQPFWAHHNNIGYSLLDFSGSSTLSSSPQTGRWSSIYASKDTSLISNDVFNLWINHGKAVNRGRYAYVVVPGISADSMPSYVNQKSIRILENSDSIQSVFHQKLNKIGIVFYKAGSIKLPDSSTIFVDQPIELLLSYSADSLIMNTATPEYKALNVNIKITSLWSGSAITTDYSLKQSRFSVNLVAGDRVGQSATTRLKKVNSNTTKIQVNFLSQFASGTLQKTDDPHRFKISDEVVWLGLYNSNGNLLLQDFHPKILDIKHLAQGSYYIRFKTEFSYEKAMIQK